MAHATTVRELRLFLDALEAHWTQEDEQYLGKFEDTRVLVPHFLFGECLGYGPAHIVHDVTGLGIIIDQPNEVDHEQRPDSRTGKPA